MAILQFIFLFFIILLLIVLFTVGSVIMRIINFFMPKRTRGNQTYDGSEHHNNQTETPSSAPQKKIFSADEGEYVDFEEIK